ncbi:MAG: hypothetical protein WCK49_07850, partial [Myxococcaceae bacterium]
MNKLMILFSFFFFLFFFFSFFSFSSPILGFIPGSGDFAPSIVEYFKRPALKAERIIKTVFLKPKISYEEYLDEHKQKIQNLKKEISEFVETENLKSEISRRDLFEQLLELLLNKNFIEDEENDGAKNFNDLLIKPLFQKNIDFSFIKII